MPPLSALGEGVQSTDAQPGSTSAADEGHQELPRGSWSELASPQPDATSRNITAAVQAGLTATGGEGSHPVRHRGGPSRRAQRGLGSQCWGEGPLERVPGNPILLWAGGCWETEPCLDWESRVFIRGDGKG